tara:strand:+ start:4298 stop:5590 length:1293 start_codon:yes stop_codon:yes gene_type:complete
MSDAFANLQSSIGNIGGAAQFATEDAERKYQDALKKFNTPKEIESGLGGFKLITSGKKVGETALKAIKPYARQELGKVWSKAKDATADTRAEWEASARSAVDRGLGNARDAVTQAVQRVTGSTPAAAEATVAPAAEAEASATIDTLATKMGSSALSSGLKEAVGKATESGVTTMAERAATTSIKSGIKIDEASINAAKSAGRSEKYIQALTKRATLRARTEARIAARGAKRGAEAEAPAAEAAEPAAAPAAAAADADASAAEAQVVGSTERTTQAIGETRAGLSGLKSELGNLQNGVSKLTTANRAASSTDDLAPARPTAAKPAGDGAPEVPARDFKPGTGQEGADANLAAEGEEGGEAVSAAAEAGEISATEAVGSVLDAIPGLDVIGAILGVAGVAVGASKKKKPTLTNPTGAASSQSTYSYQAGLSN